ncbi:MarP family serine protease [Gordonia sp. TBRC 11910]|uniref:MarP family serine protease n=1 Tax=Gordonia asplenii TaxID=2725283 RepID=A0A848L241_9ACTN|nr:MarP family serine protease [Gordonia asplenii]NMO03155.1 MarP family serine protease [Gordonia asplenii]
MSGGTWVDIVIIVVALIAAASGYRQGAVASALAFFGVVLGAVAGILLAPRVISHFNDTSVRLAVGIGMLLLLVVVGEVAGMVLGRAARGTLRLPALRFIDSVIGAVLQAIAVFAAAWLLSIPISHSAAPSLAGAVDDSKTLGVVEAIAPQWLRNVPTEFSNLLESSGLPQVIGPFGSAPVASVDPPDAALTNLPAVSTARRSVVKIRGEAPSCQRSLEGSGFVISPERVMTNAHVVAGTTKLVVINSNNVRRTASVVYFDSNTDVAVLDVPGLPSPAMRFADAPAASGDDAIALGFPEDGPFTASPLRIRGTINLEGPNIYQTGKVTREVYTARGSIRQGNSGGPMINSDGEVLGVVFGAAENTADETGFMLTAKQVQSAVSQGGESNTEMSTGACVSG